MRRENMGKGPENSSQPEKDLLYLLYKVDFV